MKKFLVFLAVILTILSLGKENNVIIPKNSIRFRVIANSNTMYDQLVKEKVVDDLEEYLKNINFSDIETTRKEINNNINTIDRIVNKSLIDTPYSNSYNINYGSNHFPEKIYKKIEYPEGNYESLVITIGEGKGNNFWCVLFPPLCKIEDTENIEYTSLVREILKRYKT